MGGRAVFAVAATAGRSAKIVDSNYVVIIPAWPRDNLQRTLAGLKDQGFKTVINLRTAGEPGYVDEAKALAAQGIRYVHVPITPATFSAADVAAVRAVLDDPASGPVLLHCASANRVGGRSVPPPRRPPPRPNK
jgi:uncharacterized protein (TIGR01244 family)